MWRLRSAAATGAWLAAWFVLESSWIALAAPLALASVEGLIRVAIAWRRRRRLATLAGLRALSPAAFERAVAAWFARDGWVVEHRGGAGDEGIDLLAFRGPAVIAIQCKRYAAEAAVSPAQVRELYGAATAAGATHALLVTTGRVSRGALAWREQLTGAPALDFLAGEELRPIALGHARLALSLPPAGSRPPA